MKRDYPYFISVDEAFDIIKQHPISVSEERIPIESALHRILSRSVFSKINVPSFDQSAVDGFAIIYENNAQMSWEIMDEIPAGMQKEFYIKPAQAYAVYTGAPIPTGANTVIMQEDVIIENNCIVGFKKAIKVNANIRWQSEQIKKEDEIVSSNAYIHAHHISLFASVGINQVWVKSKIKVALIISGNELVDPSAELAFGQVYDSNSYLLKAKLSEWPAEIIYYKAIEDDSNVFKESIHHALHVLQADLLIISGGISVGKYDFTLQALLDNQVEPLFYKIRQKPGKPMLFAKFAHQRIVALPGNPASVAMCLEIYMRALFDMPSSDYSFPLAHDYEVKSELTQFIKAKVIQNEVHVLNHQESYKMLSFNTANAWLRLDAQKFYPKGTFVHVRLIS